MKTELCENVKVQTLVSERCFAYHWNTSWVFDCGSLMKLFVEFLQDRQVHRLRTASLTSHDEERGDEESVDLADLRFSFAFVLERFLGLCMWPLLWLDQFLTPEWINYLCYRNCFSQALVAKLVTCYSCQMSLTFSAFAIRALRP